MLMHPVYSREYVEAVAPTHRTPVKMHEKVGGRAWWVGGGQRCRVASWAAGGAAAAHIAAPCQQRPALHRTSHRRPHPRLHAGRIPRRAGLPQGIRLLHRLQHAGGAGGGTVLAAAAATSALGLRPPCRPPYHLHTTALQMDEHKWLARFIYLETVAGVPGMVAGGPGGPAASWWPRAVAVPELDPSRPRHAP